MSFLMIGLAITTIVVVLLKLVPVTIATNFIFTTFIIYLLYDNFVFFKNKKEKEKIQDNIKESLTKAEYEEYLEFGPRG